MTKIYEQIITLSKHALFLLLFLFCFHIQGQIKNKGVPFLKSYTSADYNASDENYTILQDARGIVYFANGDGVLEFDGTFWNLIPVRNKSKVRSLAEDENGRIYVGAQVEFGYLQTNEVGEYKYHSLVSKIPSLYRNFNDVWKTYVTHLGVIFQTDKCLYIYNDNTIEAIPSETTFRYCCYVNGQFYVYEEGVGVFMLKNGNLQLINGGQRYQNDEVRVILPFDNKKVLIISEKQGFMIYDGLLYKKWELKFSEDINNAHPCDGLALDDDKYIVATTLGGIYLFYKNGKLVQHIDRTLDLQSNKVNSVFLDKHKNLWVTGESGIDYIEIDSPFSRFNDKSGLLGAGLSSCLKSDTLYVGTTHGIFYKKWEKYDYPLDDNTRFKFMRGSEDPVYYLESYGSNLLFGHHRGTFTAQKNDIKKISPFKDGWSIKEYDNDHRFLIEGSNEGIILFENTKNEIKFKAHVYGFNEPAKYIEIDRNKNIWVSHERKGIWRIRLNETLDSVVYIQKYGSNDGLPSQLRNKVFKIHDELMFSTNRGVYKYDAEKDRFYEDKALSDVIGRTYVKWLFQDKKGYIWYEKVMQRKNSPNLTFGIGILIKQGKDVYENINVPFLKFRGKNFKHIAPIDGSNVLLGSEEGFIHYTYDDEKNYDIPFSASVRKVELFNQADSMIFGGTFVDIDGKPSYYQPESKIYKFPNNYNAIRFSFSSMFYENNERIEYKYFLEGPSGNGDRNWSRWSTETQKEYNNLGEGMYTFHVKAKNVYDNISEEATYTFYIKPPWHETYLTYSIEVSILLLLMFISFYFRRKKRFRRFSFVITLLLIITVFQTVVEILEKKLDESQGGGVLIFTIVMNIILAMSLNPIEYRIRRKLSQYHKKDRFDDDDE